MSSCIFFLFLCGGGTNGATVRRTVSFALYYSAIQIYKVLCIFSSENRNLTFDYSRYFSLCHLIGYSFFAVFKIDRAARGKAVAAKRFLHNYVVLVGVDLDIIAE